MARDLAFADVPVRLTPCRDSGAVVQTPRIVVPDGRVHRALASDIDAYQARRTATIPGYRPANSHARRSLDPGGNRHAIAISVYHQGMPASVNVQTVHPRKLAAVRREVAPGAVGSAWGPALAKVWEFIRSQSGLRTVSRSRVHLNLGARCMRPKRERARLPSPSTAARTTA